MTRPTTILAPGSNFVQLATTDVPAINNSGGAVALKEVLMFDLAAVPLDAARETYAGRANSLVNPLTAGLTAYPSGVVVDLLAGTGQVGEEVLMRVQGMVDINVLAASATAIEAPLFMKTAENKLTSDDPTGLAPVVGVALQVGSTDTEILVYFDGLTDQLGTGAA